MTTQNHGADARIRAEEYGANVIYKVNEWLGTNVANLGDFYPGRFAPQTENDNKFVVYNIIPGQMYDLFALKVDIVDYTFYNSNFTELQTVVRRVAALLNVQDIQVSGPQEPGFIIQDTLFTATGRGQAHFADGVEHYFINAELMIKYTES